MPIVDGFELCDKLRADAHFNNTIIAFLTARSESFTHVSALDKGGDDFITKPIKPNVLVSRIKALLRRHPEFIIGDHLNEKQFGDLTINYEAFSVKKNNKELNLVKKEFELLAFLSSKPGRVFKREEILNKVWGNDVIVGGRTIDVHIRKLREKIGSHYIQTFKGVGYKFDF